MRVFVPSLSWTFLFYKSDSTARHLFPGSSEATVIFSFRRVEQQQTAAYPSMGNPADNTTAKASYSCSKTQAHLSHYHAQPIPWENKLDALLESVRTAPSSIANRSDITIPSSDRDETSEKNWGKHGGDQLSSQPMSRPLRSRRRASLTIKTNQAWHPPCQPREVGDMHLQSMCGSIGCVPALAEKVVLAADTSRSRQTGDMVSSNHALLVHGVPSIAAAGTSTCIDSNVSSFCHASNSRPNSTATSLLSGRLTLSQRLQTMDVHETIEYLCKQGYTTTFIAEHLSVRGYRIAPGGIAGEYRKYHKWWVQEHLDKSDE